MIKTFKIYPHWKAKTNDYYQIYIFLNYKEMYNYYIETGGYHELNFKAVCRDLKTYKGIIPTSKIGEILFVKEECKISIITHECGHAVFQYLRKIYKEKIWTYLDSKNNIWKCEEMYCQILEGLIDQFIKEYNPVP